jgi:hypothetical protein
MAAKKATKKPKLALRPHKTRKPKPRRSDDEILAAARNELKKITDGPKFTYRPYKRRRTDDEILAAASKELKRITEGPKFLHRPYKPRKPKPKAKRSHSQILADAQSELRSLTGHRRVQRSLAAKQATQAPRAPSNSRRESNESDMEGIIFNHLRLGKSAIKVASFENPFIPIAFSSKKRGQADAGIVFTSETFYFVCEKHPLCLYQVAALMTGNSCEPLPMENLYSLSAFYRKSSDPWGSSKPLHVFSFEYINTPEAMKPQGFWSKLVGKPYEPDRLGLVHYSASGRRLLKTFDNNFDVAVAYRLLLDLALRELGMHRSAVFTAGSLRNIQPNSPSIR